MLFAGAIHEACRRTTVNQLGWDNGSNSVPLGQAQIVNETAATSSDCEAVVAARDVDVHFPCYELSRDSGALSFWDEQEEDIYTFEDGEEA